MIKGTLEQIKAFGMCDPGFAAHEQYMVENNLTEMTFDEAVALDKRAGRRDWAIFAYEKKPLLAQAVGYVIPPEEAAADAAYLQSLKDGVPTGKYRFCGQNYDDLQSAQNAKQEHDAKYFQESLDLTLVNLAVLDENEHEVWTVANLDTAVEPTSGVWSYKVFNHSTGTYVNTSSLEEARTTRQTLAAQSTMHPKESIYAINIHADFPNSPILIPIE